MATYRLTHSEQQGGSASTLLRTAAVASLALPLFALGGQSLRSGAAPALYTAPKANTAALHAAFGRVPLHFAPNVGQAGHGVSYVAEGSGYGLSLSATGSTLVLGKTSRQAGHSSAPAVLSMRLQGANSAATASGLGRQSSESNYMTGAKGTWHTGVANYSRVRYTGVYPGVDMEYYGTQQHVEYDFVVAPGANPSAIGLRFSGARKVALDHQGNLVLTLANGTVTERAPQLYQQGAQGKVTVSGRFVLAGSTVRFAVGSYDHGKTLVIDPVINFSFYLGGSNDDSGNGIALDAAGNVYVAGSTYSTDFPTTPGAFQTAQPFAGRNAFVSKFTPDGQTLVYSTYLGGTTDDTGGDALAVNGAGNAFITGYTYATDFPTTPNAVQLTDPSGTYTAYVTELDTAGATLVYSTYLGGTNGDEGYGIALDSTGMVYVTGYTYSTDFPVTTGAFQTTNTEAVANGGDTAFVAKLNPAAAAPAPLAVGARAKAAVTVDNPASLIYATFLGGTGDDDEGYSIAVNAAGNAYVTGLTDSTDFPVTTGAFQTTNKSTVGSYDAFVTELNAAGSALVYSTYLGGADDDYGYAIALDAAGNAYVTGETYSLNFPLKTPFQSVNKAAVANDGSSAFVTKVNPTGSALVYSTYLGGTGSDQAGYGIAVDGTGAAYVTGWTDSTDFPTTVGAPQRAVAAAKTTAKKAAVLRAASKSSQAKAHAKAHARATTHAVRPQAIASNFDAFVTKLTAAGTRLAFSTYLGGSDDDYGYGIATDPAGDVFVTGETFSVDFPTVNPILDATTGYDGSLNHGGYDAFVTSYGVSGCSVLVNLLGVSGRFAAVQSFSSPTSTFPTVSYMAFQSGTSGFTATFPAFSCTVGTLLPAGSGTPASITVDGTVQSLIGKGPNFHVGDSVTAVISYSPTGVTTATVTNNTTGVTFTTVLGTRFGSRASELTF